MAGTKRTQAVLLLLAAAVLWSLAGVLIKWVSLSALTVAGFRGAIALPVLLLFFGRQAVNFSAAQLIGGVCYAATVTLFVSATKLTTSGNAILLQYTAPLYVALLSGWLLYERTRWFDWAANVAVLCGMSLFFIDQLSADGLTGNILAVLSGFAFASLIIAMRRQKDASPAGSAIALQMLFRLPIKIGALLTLAVVFTLILTNSYSRLERYIIGFVSLIGLSFIFELVLVQIAWPRAAVGWVMPRIPQGSIPIVMSVLGAVVMPHNLFLHSEIIQSRQWHVSDESVIARQLKYEFLDTLYSMIVGQNPIDTQDPSSYTLIVKKEVLIDSSATFPPASVWRRPTRPNSPMRSGNPWGSIPTSPKA